MIGLWDARDELWLGNDKGPAIYTDDTLARLGATIATAQLGRQVQAKPMTSVPDKKRDEIETPLTTAEAIKKVETDWRLIYKPIPDET